MPEPRPAAQLRMGAADDPGDHRQAHQLWLFSADDRTSQWGSSSIREKLYGSVLYAMLFGQVLRVRRRTWLCDWPINPGGNRPRFTSGVLHFFEM